MFFHNLIFFFLSFLRNKRIQCVGLILLIFFIVYFAFEHLSLVLLYINKPKNLNELYLWQELFFFNGLFIGFLSSIAECLILYLLYTNHTLYYWNKYSDYTINIIFFIFAALWYFYMPPMSAYLPHVLPATLNDFYSLLSMFFLTGVIYGCFLGIYFSFIIYKLLKNK